MSTAIIAEWHFWLVSIAAGASMAFVYDFLRLFRRIVKHNRFCVDAEDLLFWAACFIASFTLLYYENNGVIRFAVVFGAGLGMLAYELSIGRFFVKYSYLLIDKLFTPIIRFIRKILKKAGIFVQIWLTKLKNRLKIICKSIKALLKIKKREEKGINAKRIKKKKKKFKSQKKDTQISPLSK